MEKEEKIITEIYPQGIKWTKQRRDVYDILLQAKQPLNAVQIYQQIGSCGNYAVSTIYRILTVFEEKQLVTKTNWSENGTFVYELNRGGHRHYAVCLECHKRVPLEKCPFESMGVLPVPHDHGQEESCGENLTEGDFLITGHKLELYGYCKKCRGRQVN